MGIYHPKEAAPARKPHRKAGGRYQVDLLGRAVPVEQTKDGARAVIKDQVVHPGSVERYLEGKFGEQLDAARSAMEALAHKLGPEELARSAFGLYEQFRPVIPAGVKGWGAAEKLDLGQIVALG